MKLTEKLRSRGISLLLVEDQIKIKAPKGYLSPPVIHEIRQNRKSLIRYLKEHGDLLTQPERYGYPVTPSQRRLWLMSHYNGGNTAYQVSDVLVLKGLLHLATFAKAVRKTIERHEILRTAIREDEFGILKQFVLDSNRLNFQVDCQDVSRRDEVFIHSLLDEKLAMPFNLGIAPLIRVSLFKRSPERYLLLLIMHHAVTDGWSVEVLKREIIRYYNRLLEDKHFQLPDLEIQYKDYAYWINSKKEQKELEEARAFWHQQFADTVPTLNLPSVLTRPEFKTFNGTRIQHVFSRRFTQLLKEFAQAHGATLFMSLMAGLNALFYRYSGHTDIVVGAPVANRHHANLKDQIGLYLNTLAIRTQFLSSDTFPMLLGRQKKILLDTYVHQSYPFDQLIEDLGVFRDTARSPLFDIMVIFHNQQNLFEEAALEDVRMYRYDEYSVNRSHFDLSFFFSERKGQLHLELEYNTDVHTSDFVYSLLDHFEILVLNGIKFPNRAIKDIEYVSRKEAEWLLYRNNPPINKYESTTTIVDLLRRQFERTPGGAVALFCEDRSLSYQELDQLSSRLAIYLIREYSLGLEDFVAIKLERNEWLLVSIIAVLKSGATYVPIDLSYPPARIAWIETDSQCKCMVDQKVIEQFLNKPETGEALQPVEIPAQTPAYIIYTSGSTGVPKGVVLTHANAVAFLDWCCDEFAKTDFEVLLAVTSQCFDLSIFEFFYPLITGRTVRILPSALYLKEYLEVDDRIMINTVPSVLDALIKNNASFDRVCAVNLAGEPIPISLSNILTGYDFEFRNLYGPSEDTTYSTCYQIRDIHHHSIPIGRPIANTQVTILSEGSALQAPGHLGEICLSGAGLARGYLNRNDLTREKFISHPYFQDQLMYRTGDLGYWQPDGIIMYVGRKDHQIKIRGFRIELGEIEFKLSEDTLIADAIVLVREDADNQHITAYLTGDRIDLNGVHERLSAGLPTYMLPTRYAILREIPRTSNGKVDRTALLQQPVQSICTTTYEAPHNETEEQLLAIWKHYLKRERIGINDNFFELGGHSLKMTRMLNEVQTHFQLKIPFELFLQDPTIASLALHIEHKHLIIGTSDYKQKIII